MTPYFSIVIPTLNEEQYLPLILSDLIKQKMKNFEVIIVDGTSEDNTCAIANSFSKSFPVRQFVVKKRNVSYQRNIGAGNAQGQYVVFLDADARISPAFTKKLDQFVRSHKGLVYIPAILPDELNSQTKVVFNFANFIVELSQGIGRPFSSGGSMVFEKNFFLLIGGFSEKVFMSEDHQVIQEAFKYGVHARFMRDIKVKMSLRRMKKEGRLKLFYKYLLTANIIHTFHKSLKHAVLGGLLGAFIVNLAGNLHTIYLFTKGYNTENPVPFWQILSAYNPTKYWYPNATRFIPLTIHEFPSYSYVVADLHGHVFDIPFVLTTLALLFVFFIRYQTAAADPKEKKPAILPYAVMFGFLTAVHYMTNAFDGPIYMLFIGLLFLIAFGFSRKLLLYGAVLVGSFLVFSYPFSSHFSPFVSGIGVNCSPDALTGIGKFGPFLFEQGKCQPDPLWMLFILWGFFWMCFALFFLVKYIEQKIKHHISASQLAVDDFIFTAFTFGTILILIPEFFYIKDIYPAHFRANTMFKLGYQAFIVMGIASAYTAYRIALLKKIPRLIMTAIFILFFIFIFIYPFYSFPSYYAGLNKAPKLNGIQWLETYYPEDKEIVDYLNNSVTGQPTILEAQGDSYTDFERISANTGLPTVAGWWVHEWLWRGSADVVGKRIPDILAMYESKDLAETKKLIQKYRIRYVVVSRMERDKYQFINEDKFNLIGKKVFTSSNGFGALYKVD